MTNVGLPVHSPSLLNRSTTSLAVKGQRVDHLLLGNQMIRLDNEIEEGVDRV